MANSTVTRRCGCVRDLTTDQITSYCKEHRKFEGIDKPSPDPLRRIEEKIDKLIEMWEKKNV